MTFESFIIPLCKNHKTIPKTMERCYFKWATTCVVAVISLLALSSCVNEKYEISEENLDLNATIFQEGVSIPLGSTTEITLESLVSMLGEESADFLKELEGAYLFSMSDSFDMSADIQEAFSGIGGLEGISMNESFSFNLSNIDLSSVEIKGQPIGPNEVNIAEMLQVPDINNYLPSLQESLNGISITLPEVNAGDLSLDLSDALTDLTKTVDIAQLETKVNVPDQIKKNPELYEKAMDYEALRKNEVLQMAGLQLPEIESYEFQSYEVTIPLHIVMPEQIRSVKSIKLHDNASFKIAMQVLNPLFTSGTFSPKLNIDLHQLLCVEGVEDGVIHGEFDMTAEGGWAADRAYHITSLAIADDEWKQEDGRLVLDKEVTILVSGSLENNGYYTTVKHLEENGGSMMQLKLDFMFTDLEIDDVQMEMEPVNVSKNLELALDINPIKLPTMVKSVDYIEFNQEYPLSLNMNATVPDMCKDMDISLKTLKIEFPEGFEVTHDAVKDAGLYDSSTRTLVYSNIKLADGLNEDIKISRLNFGPLADGYLSYSGVVKVTAEACAQGVVSSKSILDATGSRDLSVSVDVNYHPQLTDYCVQTADYPYEVDENSIEIKEPISEEIAEMFNGNPVTVTPKKVNGENPKIIIRLIAPDVKAIRLTPDKTQGLKIDFPDMIQFAAGSLDAYRYNPEENSIEFVYGDQIPEELVLEVTGLKILPVKDGDSYYVKDNMNLIGTLCVAGTEVHMADVKEIQDKDAKIIFEAEISDLAAAEIGLDEYMINISESVEIDGMSVEVPEMIGSLSISQFTLKDVYLSLNIDASGVADLVGDATMTVNMDITVPKVLMIDGVQNGVLHIERTFENGVLAMEPIKINGIDLSGVQMTDGKITIDPMSVVVDGSVKIKDLSINMDSLKDRKIEVSISGALATRDADGNMTDTIQIDRIAGNVGLSIDPVETEVDLSEFAEALNGENISAVIDLSTFWIALDINTNLQIPVKGAVEITPYFGEEAGAPTSLEIELNPDDRTEDGFTIYISNKDPQNPAVIYKAFDLMSILYKKADGQKPALASRLLVKLNAGIDPEKECVINPTETYVFSADYSVGLPLALGEDFSFEYRDVITDLPEEAGQLLAYGSLGLGGKITNGLPLRLDLQLRLLDSEGNVIPMKEGAGKMEIAPCDPTGKAVTSPIDLVLGGIDKTATDLHAIEVVLTVDSKGAAGVPFKKDSFIQVALSAKIPEGITMDLGAIAGQEDTNE